MTVVSTLTPDKQDAIRKLTEEIAEYEKMYNLFKDRFPIMANKTSIQKEKAYIKITKIMST